MGLTWRSSLIVWCQFEKRFFEVLSSFLMGRYPPPSSAQTFFGCSCEREILRFQVPNHTLSKSHVEMLKFFLWWRKWRHVNHFLFVSSTWWNKNQVNVHSSNQMCLYKCMKKEQILSNKNKKNHCNAEWCHFAISTIAKLSWSFSSNNWSKVVFFCNGPAFICINLKDKCSQPFDIKWIFSWNSCRAVFFGKKLTLPCKRNVWWRDEQTTIQFSAPDFEMVQCLKSMESFL